MGVIYENQIKAMGECVEEFKDEGIMIIFGDGAPEELQDFCYTVSVNPIHGVIAAGQTLQMGDESYKITAVGEEAPVTLSGLGHCSFRFNGSTEVELPGTIYLENKAMPEMKVGTVIRIID